MTAWTKSGVYLLNWIDALDATQLAIDLSLTTNTLALFDSSVTPDFSADAAFTTTGECTSTNYTSKGAALANPTVTESPTGSIMWDNTADVSWTPVTLTSQGGIVIDGTTGTVLIMGIYWGAEYTATAGTFTVTPNVLGLLTLANPA